MTLRKIQLSTAAVVFATLFFAAVSTHPTGSAASARNVTSAKAPAANWVFEGCWTQFSAGPCRDVFRDQQGGHHICRECGTTGNPGPGKCNPISQATLASGFWCS
jgi:hypothetical protein